MTIEISIRASCNNIYDVFCMLIVLVMITGTKNGVTKIKCCKDDVELRVNDSLKRRINVTVTTRIKQINMAFNSEVKVRLKRIKESGIKNI